MMGRLDAQEALFYKFSLEDHVPQEHLLRQPANAAGRKGLVRQTEVK